MGIWCEGVEREHEILLQQAEALETALTVDVPPEERRIVLSWIIRNLWPALGLHLRKEEEVLFPAVRRLLGEGAGAVTLMREQHQELREAHRRLAELLQFQEHVDWVAIHVAAEGLINLMEDHQNKERHLILDVMGFSLKLKNLKELAGEFENVGRRIHEEDGWPETILSKKVGPATGRPLEKKEGAVADVKLG